MPAVYVLPYKWHSLSAVRVSRLIKAKRINVLVKTYRPQETDIVVNWGNSSEFAQQIAANCGKIFNHPDKVALAVNKIRFLEVCKDAKLPGPTWTRDKKTAKEWAKDHIVVCRTLVEASAGKGIILVEPGMEVPDAKLYTLYSPKRWEFRIHVAGGDIVDVQQKRLKNGIENANYKIRSHANGWVFARYDITVPDKVNKAALATVDALGLDFGAVDIGWMESKNRPTVYEVNTAPGLEGTTLDNYSKIIKRMVYPHGKNRDNNSAA